MRLSDYDMRKLKVLQAVHDYGNEFGHAVTELKLRFPDVDLDKWSTSEVDGNCSCVQIYAEVDDPDESVMWDPSTSMCANRNSDGSVSAYLMLSKFETMTVRGVTVRAEVEYKLKLDSDDVATMVDLGKIIVLTTTNTFTYASAVCGV